jgi:hypothetical protein
MTGQSGWEATSHTYPDESTKVSADPHAQRVEWPEFGTSYKGVS